MVTEPYNLKIVLILTVGFGLASILGYITHILRLSPILGYLIAGYIIGPYSPGYSADLHLAEQLAEIGVILMMFGVGIHFKLEDLVKVKNIAIPGAIGQILVSALASTFLVHYLGWTLEAGIMIGLAIGVASTVVLVRVLTDNQLLDTEEGHIAIGWLIVEDIVTVIVLIMLPALAYSFKGGAFSIEEVGSSILIALGKFVLLLGIMLTLGKRVVKYILFLVARTRSHELFTLTVLALIFCVATGSAFIFGTSIALGAFIAGMAIGQTEVRHQASANSLPMKDAFLVIFFLTVGMLFNPAAIFTNFPLFVVVLGVILLIKPFIAILIVLALKYPAKTAVTIAIALAQIGEFSFILAEEAMKLEILPDEGFDIIVACALISIALNPLLFQGLDWLKGHLETKSDMKARGEGSFSLLGGENKALVIGYGPIGQEVSQTLEELGYETTIVERNVDTVAKLRETQGTAVFGDATHSNILEIANVETTDFLVITVPDISTTLSIISEARRINPNIAILARLRYQADEPALIALGVPYVCCEVESAKAFRRAILYMGDSE